jgi:hypothetical protein
MSRAQEEVTPHCRDHQQPALGQEDLVRDILARYPQAEEVFQRHGLGGCGGPQGPLEPIGFFAVAHHLDPEALLQELNEMVSRLDIARQRGDREPGQQPDGTQAAPIYPGFILASLLLAAGAGFSLGVWGLLTATEGLSTSPFSWATLIQVHGQVQVWGFVGLFVMGIAYHAVPRFRGASLGWVDTTLARMSLWLVLAGITLRAAQLGLPLPWAYPVVMVGSVALLIGAGLFAWVIGRLLLKGLDWEGYEGYLLAGAIWLVLAAAYQVGLIGWLWWTGGIVLSPAFNESYLTLLFFGFVLMMTLGMSARTLPVFLGLKRGHSVAVAVALWLVVTGSILLAAGQGLGGAQAWAQWLAAAGGLLLLVGVVSFLSGLRLFESGDLTLPDLSRQGIPSSYRYFIRVAYAWLLAAALLGAYLSFRPALGGPPTAMTEASAARHALALGFVTLIIVGMATRILPVFSGNRLFSARLQQLAFWLLFTSAALRVSVELVWSYGSALDPLLSTSGVLGLAGIAVFAANIWLTLQGRTLRPGHPSGGDGPGVPGKLDIGPGTPLSAVVERVPSAIDTLLAHGVYMLGDPQHREAALRTLTLEQAARMARVEVAPLIETLRNSATGGSSPGEEQIGPAMIVADVLERFPETLKVFLFHGFTPLANPSVRQKLATTVTVAQAAQMRDVNLVSLVRDLNAAVSQERTLWKAAEVTPSQEEDR